MFVEADNAKFVTKKYVLCNEHCQIKVKIKIHHEEM